MSTFLRSFADDGGTVLVSSHLLREMEATRFPHTVADDGSVTVTTSEGVDAAAVARAAVGAGVLLVELRPSDSAGLEQLFFDLTRPGAAADAAPTLAGAR